MNSDSPPRVGSAAQRSDAGASDAAPVAAAARAIRPPTPKITQRFVNPIAKDEKAAERARAAKQRKGRKMRCPPTMGLDKDSLESVAAFGLLVRSSHRKLFKELCPDATVVSPAEVPREALGETSLAWIATIGSPQVIQQHEPLPLVVGKCLTKLRPTADEVLQMQSSEAIRSSISSEPEGSFMRSNSVLMLASLEPKKKKASDFRVSYGEDHRHVASDYLPETGLPKGDRKRRMDQDATVEASDGVAEEDDDEDPDGEYAPKEGEVWDRGDGFTDIGEHVAHGRRNLMTLPLLRDWQHRRAQLGVHHDQVLLDSPRSVFVAAQAGVLLKNLRVSASPSEESLRRKLTETLQSSYKRLTHAVSQEDFIRLVCSRSGDTSKSPSRHVKRPPDESHDARSPSPAGEGASLASATSVSFGDAVTDTYGDAAPFKPSPSKASLDKRGGASPLRGSPSNKYIRGAVTSKEDIALLLRRFQHHTGALTATWSHHQEVAANKLLKEQQVHALTKEARQRKVLLSQAMQTCGNLERVRALDAPSGQLAYPTGRSALAILPPRSASAMEGTLVATPTPTQHGKRSQRGHTDGAVSLTSTMLPGGGGYNKRRPHSPASDETYRSDDENLFLEKRLASSSDDEDPDLHSGTDSHSGAERRGSRPVSRQCTPGLMQNRGPSGVVDPLAGTGGKGNRLLTPLEIVRLQFKETEARRIAEAEAAVKRKDRAVVLALERRQVARDQQKADRAARNKEVTEKNQRTKRLLAFESLQLVNHQELKAKTAARRQKEEADAYRERNENTMRRQLIAHEAKQTVRATERALLKDMFALEVHAQSADELRHSKEAQATLLRGIHTEQEQEREWRRRRLLNA